MIGEDTARFVEGADVAIWVATASVECVPQTTRSLGARVDERREHVRLFLQAEQSARVLANVRAGAIMAATFVRIHDYRAVQIKGEITGTHVCGDDERTWSERYIAGFAEANEKLGLPRALIERLAYWPSVAVDVAVRELFAQTPGPNAGVRL